MKLIGGIGVWRRIENGALGCNVWRMMIDGRCDCERSPKNRSSEET